jgi:hypothetical protein
LANIPSGPFGNITQADLQKEHVVFFNKSEKSVVFRVFNNTGQAKKFSGFDWGVGVGKQADLYQHTVPQQDGSDFYLEFNTTQDAVDSGLVKGVSFKLDQLGGTNIDPYIGNILRFRKLSVQSVSGNKVNISTGYGIGNTGLVISQIFGKRSGYFPGFSSIQYFFDKTTTYNKDNVLEDLSILFYGYSESSNPNFTSSYIYDPDGKKTKVTVSRFLAKTQNKILKGDNLVSVVVDRSEADDGTKFPTFGHIILNYGTDKAEGPIRYSAILAGNNTAQIITDPAYKFKFTHDSGTQVQVIRRNFPFFPGIDGANYPTYLTGTTTARQTMFFLIRELLASGIFLEEDVIKPEQRYSDSSVSVFD